MLGYVATRTKVSAVPGAPLGDKALHREGARVSRSELMVSQTLNDFTCCL